MAHPGVPSCLVSLPYPAPECGTHHIHCLICDQDIIVTAAGRPDDPISIRISCLISKEAQ